MQINLSTDYAIRILLYLYIHEKASSLEMSKDLGISRNYIKKLMTKTSLQDLVISSSGVCGGFVLRYEVENLTMYEIFKKLEPTMYVNCCLENQNQCNACISFVDTCPIRSCYQRLQDKIDIYLKTTTIRDLSQDHEAFEKNLRCGICK